jgi:hypothetical protein
MAEVVGDNEVAQARSLLRDSQRAMDKFASHHVSSGSEADDF